MAGFIKFCPIRYKYLYGENEKDLYHTVALH